MKFDLRTPCSNCPFRSDRRFHLMEERLEEIRDALQTSTFSCHKTVDYSREDCDDDGGHHPGPEEQHCAGALIMLEKLGEPSQMMRIAERIGLYDPRKLDMDAPVYDSWEEMIDNCAHGINTRNRPDCRSCTGSSGEPLHHPYKPSYLVRKAKEQR